MSSGGRLSIKDGRGAIERDEQLGDGQLSRGAHVCLGWARVVFYSCYRRMSSRRERRGTSDERGARREGEE